MIPESLRFKMDRARKFTPLMEETGANIRVIKQLYDEGEVQERLLVLFGKQRDVEMALEKVGILLQESDMRTYKFMKYPDLTYAYRRVREGTAQVRLLLLCSWLFTPLCGVRGCHRCWVGIGLPLCYYLLLELVCVW